YDTGGGDFVVTGPATLLSDTDVATSGGLIRFTSTIDGGFLLDLDASSGGNVELQGIIGGGTPLSQLDFTTSGIGIIDIGNNITTTGTQNYSGAVTLSNNVVLTGSSFIPSGTITGGGNDLTLDFTSPINISSTGIEGSGTSGIGTLTSSGAGGTTLSGVITDIASSYVFNNPVTLVVFAYLGVPTPVTGNIIFNSTLNGAALFFAVADGIINFAADIGGSTPLASFLVNASGGANFAAGVDITGTGDLDFSQNIDFAGA
ncbi:unnamed protein product, partial [marine sediment metagenome]